MKFFSEKPIRRLVFIFTYAAFSLWIVIRSFTWLNVFLALVMLFGCYIAVVKANIKQDKYADGINDYMFDLLSIILTIFVLIDFLLNR